MVYSIFTMNTRHPMQPEYLIRVNPETDHALFEVMDHQHRTFEGAHVGLAWRWGETALAAEQKGGTRQHGAWLWPDIPQVEVCSADQPDVLENLGRSRLGMPDDGTATLLIVSPDTFNRSKFRDDLDRLRQTRFLDVVVSDVHDVQAESIVSLSSRMVRWLQDRQAEPHPAESMFAPGLEGRPPLAPTRPDHWPLGAGWAQALNRVIQDTWSEAGDTNTVNPPQERGHEPYLRISARLRDPATGRLDATKVGDFFGLKNTELATLCGVSKQSIGQNPTSLGIQGKLAALDVAARGLLLCRGDEAQFKVWLSSPNPDFVRLEGRHASPLELIRLGHAQVVADHVTRKLYGTPG